MDFINSKFYKDELKKFNKKQDILKNLELESNKKDMINKGRLTKKELEIKTIPNITSIKNIKNKKKY